jgi:hypothetical protein
MIRHRFSARVRRATAGALFAVASGACTTPRQYSGSIVIDEAGLAARLRSACALGKAPPTEGVCAARDEPGKL